MSSPNNDEELDKKIGEKYPGTWDMIEISSENAHGEDNSYICANKIANAAKSVKFPIIIGVRIETPVSTDGRMWTCLIRVGWPSGEPISSVINIADIENCDLGRIDVRQSTKANYSAVLSSCTALDWKKREMKKVWRCNYHYSEIFSPASHPKGGIMGLFRNPFARPESKADEGEARSNEKSINKYTKNIEKILSDKFTSKFDLSDWDKYAINEITDMLKSWTHGDGGAIMVLRKLVRGEFKASNYHIGRLREFSLKAISSLGQESIEELLSLLRDNQGNLCFKKEEYDYWPKTILQILEDIALARIETKKLVYEFISIGTKLDKMGIPNNHGGVALFNIQKVIYGGDEKSLFSPPFPLLSENEKDFLAKRKYTSYGEEIDAGKKGDYDLNQLVSSKSIGDLILIFNKKNRSDKDVLQALIGFIDDPRVPPELMKIFTEGAIRLDNQYKVLALKALNQVQDQSFQSSSVLYSCEGCVDSSSTIKTSVEINVRDLLVLKEIEYLNHYESFDPWIPHGGQGLQRGTWFQVRDKRISKLTLASGPGIWNSTTVEITTLPDTMGYLTGLIDLDLRGQSGLKAVPASLNNLKNLTIHLDRDSGVSRNREPEQSDEGAEKVVVGTCEACNRPLRVYRRGLRTRMRLTCKCGYLNIVRKGTEEQSSE